MDARHPSPKPSKQDKDASLQMNKISLARYQYADEYTSRELEILYQQAAPRGRIRLLRNFFVEGRAVAPDKILSLAVNDPSIEVRIWLARNGWGLDLDGANFEATLRNDADPFVRASIFENPELTGALLGLRRKITVTSINVANHMERLALMRNPHLPGEIAAKVFDPSDKEITIDLKERASLCYAYLSNENVLPESKRSARIPVDDIFDAGRYEDGIWESLAEWPEEWLFSLASG